MARVLIFAPNEQNRVEEFAEKLIEADPGCVLIVTVDMPLETAVEFLKVQQTLADQVDGP